jgi:methionine-rich copper-binding protein CopC
MKFLRLLPLLGACCLTSSLLFAHAELKQANPANGSIVNEAPAELELVFTEEVQLLKLAISGIDGKMVATSFKPTAVSRTTFSVPLPALAKDAYVVAFTIIGKDGHQVENKLRFIVDAVAAESAGSPVTSHSEHSE